VALVPPLSSPPIWPLGQEPFWPPSAWLGGLFSLSWFERGVGPPSWIVAAERALALLFPPPFPLIFLFVLLQSICIHLRVHTRAHSSRSHTLIGIFFRLAISSRDFLPSSIFFCSFSSFFFLFFVCLLVCSPKTLSKNPHVTSHKD